MSRPIRSLDYALRRIRELEATRRSLREIAIRYEGERKLLAMLAADGPCFYNPLHVAEARALRDGVLRRLRLAPDGKPLP